MMWRVPGWAGAGGRNPLWADHPASALIPEVSRALDQRPWGYPRTLERPGPDWGLNSESAVNDHFDQYVAPSTASEVVRPFDVQRCIDISEGALSSPPVTFELVRFDAVPHTAVAILERLPTVWVSALALDANGDPLLAYTGLNGEEPCRNQLVHPDPTVAPLTWTFRVTRTHAPAFGTAIVPYVSASSSPPIGDDLVEPWSDLRYGTNVRWGDRQQYVVRQATQLRYWVTFRGPAEERYRLRIGARLGGYWQLTGRRGVALTAATSRIV